MSTNQDTRVRLEAAVKAQYDSAVTALLECMRNQRSTRTARDYVRPFADELESGRRSPDFVRELLQRDVMAPADPMAPHVRALRLFFHWGANARSFDEVLPQLLDVVYLLPPRHFAICETLAPLMAFNSRPSSSLRLLDVGTGTGLLLRVLREAGVDLRAHGIDPAALLIEYGTALDRRTRLFQLTVESIQGYTPPARPFHAALCYMVLHHVPERDYSAALRTVFNSLEEGGVFAYTDKFWKGPNEGPSHGLTFSTQSLPVELESGQFLRIDPVGLPPTPSFQPHPARIVEYKRDWRVAADSLSEVGFLIESARAVSQTAVLFVCRKPRNRNWKSFATTCLAKPARRAKKGQRRSAAPYQWSLQWLKRLYVDIRRGRVSPFLMGIAYFSWEQQSRLFLVRRAWPLRFHMLSYSHVHDGWGALGKMVEDFERRPREYTAAKGYSYLTEEDVQRTLPFQGDIKELEYKAAMAAPVYHPVTHELRGALLLFLAEHADVPLHTASPFHNRLVAKLADVNRALNQSLDEQERRLNQTGVTERIAERWRSLVAGAEKPPVIVQLGLRFGEDAGESDDGPSPGEVCSRIQALLSGRDCFSVLEDPPNKVGRATILVAARPNLEYSDIEGRVLGVLGTSADKCGLVSFRCQPIDARRPGPWTTISKGDRRAASRGRTRRRSQSPG